MAFNNIIKPKLEINEQLFTRIGEHVLGNLYVADKDGNIIYCNTNCARAFECDIEKLYATNVHDLYKIGMTDRVSASSEVINTKKPVIRFIRTGNGVGMLIHGEPVFDENGELEMSVATTYTESTFMDFIDQIDEEKWRLEQALEYISRGRQGKYFLESNNKVVNDLYLLASKVAKSDCAVSIYGETGAGKEIMAEYIHNQSSRANTVYLPVNCASIPSELLEAEFFGYEKGAFTGAHEKGKPGLFEVANGGTIFLDEVGEMPAAMQSKLLRVLETGEIRRIGSNKPVRTSVRLITATNRNLRDMVEAGTFREDLYYRLNIVPINIPPLREHPEDIIALANFFINKYNKKFHTKKYFSKAACDYFLSYQWPGNIRELRNTVERMAVISNGNELDIHNSTFVFNTAPANNSSPAAMAAPQGSLSAGSVKETSAAEMTAIELGKSGKEVLSYNAPLKSAVAAYEREYIRNVIKLCGGNMTEAAKKLGIHRSNLYKTLSRISE